MYKYFFISNKWDKGFITHKDREDLDFVVTGKIAKVVGSKENKIDEWADRVEVTEITEVKALADIKQWQLDGFINRKAQIENELVEVQNKIDALKVV